MNETLKSLPTSLELIKDLKSFVFRFNQKSNLDCLYISGALDIIETALKRAEELEIENSEQFKEKWVQDNLAMTFELNVAKHKLKALEIIKEKRVNIEYIKCCDTYEQYCLICSYANEITQEEFDLLKEVLL